MPFRNTSTSLIAALAGALLPASVAAQSAAASVALEATSDLRERGLSWSAGKAAIRADATVPLTESLSLDLEAASLRSSARHGGADLDLTVSPRIDLASRGGWTLSAGANGRAFLGASGLGYGELTSDLSYSIGPARLGIGASFAPSQKALGGSNLYLEANATIGVPGTPLTVYGGGGYSSGSTRSGLLAAERVQRLRPDGAYWDHYLGAEYQYDRLALGLRYTGTSIDAAPLPRDGTGRYLDRHTGSRVTAYLRFTP